MSVALLFMSVAVAVAGVAFDAVDDAGYIACLGA